jgi:hypothetical protein
MRAVKTAKQGYIADEQIAWLLEQFRCMVNGSMSACQRM